jgi:formylglycine-generating enzyme
MKPTLPDIQPARRRAKVLWPAIGVLILLAWLGNVAWAAWARYQQERLEYASPPEGMVLVPAGWFWMGTDDPRAAPDERPLRRVFVPAFYMDRTEVTNREFRRFKPDHAYPGGADDLPATHVFKHEAEAYARWAGKRLPTAAEWEKAARGTDARQYPWGNEFDTNRCNMRPRDFITEEGVRICEITNAALRGKLTVGSFPSGASPYGCLDMCGNIWEWVSDVHRDDTWFGLLGGSQERGILRGGAYGYNPRSGTTWHQAFEPLNATCNDTGFRCAKDAVVKRD